MKSLTSTAIILIAMIVLCFSMFFSFQTISIEKALASINSTQQINLENLVDYKYSKLSAHQKKGVMFLVSIPDQTLSQSTINFLKKNKVSGVVLLGSNVVSEKQLKQLTTDLHTKVDPNLLIAIDQEGGTVTRIKWDKYANESAMSIGLKNDEDYAYEVAFYRGKLLKELGIDIILGPVADISSGPSSFMHSRCFGTDPESVSKFVAATVRGHKDAGIITVLKHFPGHGNTVTDSHSEFPVINASKAQLQSVEFKPFQAGIDAGAEMVMLGHIINPSISPKPSSMTHEYIDILRNDLKFEGIVMTDDLRMTGKIEGANPLALNIIVDSQTNIERRIKQLETNEQATKEVMLFKYTH